MRTGDETVVDMVSTQQRLVSRMQQLEIEAAALALSDAQSASGSDTGGTTTSSASSASTVSLQDRPTAEEVNIVTVGLGQQVNDDAAAGEADADTVMAGDGGDNNPRAAVVTTANTAEEEH